MDALLLNEIVFQAEPHAYIYRRKAYRSVTDRIKQVLGDDFAKVPADRLAFAQHRGVMVHRACELLERGTLDWKTVDQRIEGYVRAMELFHREKPGKIVAIERKLVSPEDDLAGRPDLVKFINGRRSVIDRKTSQNLRPRMRLQTAGYKKLWNRAFPLQPIYDRYGLRLQPNGLYKLIPHEDPDDERAFDKFLIEARARDEADPYRRKYA